jgi:nicotinamide riboside kinase
MKIAFVGSHGVGKTTLCFDLAAQLKRRGVNVDMVKEVARASPLPVNRKTSREAQLWILATQVAEEIRAASHSDVVVCDRAALDNYAYFFLACGRDPAVEKFVEMWMKTYDLLVRVPVSAEVQEDGFRDTDSVFVREIDRKVSALLAAVRTPFLDLESTPRSGWTEAALQSVLEHQGLRQGRLQGR